MPPPPPLPVPYRTPATSAFDGPPFYENAKWRWMVNGIWAGLLPSERRALLAAQRGR